MGWDQSYSKDSFEQLFEKITGQSVKKILEEKLAQTGIKIISTEPIVLNTDYYYHEYMGEKVTLSDGRKLMHKLSRSHTTDDSGHDHYGWFFEDEEPKTKRTRAIDDGLISICHKCEKEVSGVDLVSIGKSGFWCLECIKQNKAEADATWLD